MARVTVEDCLEKIPNRFDLVLKAARRARDIARGGQPFVEWENDKPTVVALREIAAGHDIEPPQAEDESPENLFEKAFEAVDKAQPPPPVTDDDDDE